MLRVGVVGACLILLIGCAHQEHFPLPPLPQHFFCEVDASKNIFNGDPGCLELLRNYDAARQS